MGFRMRKSFKVAPGVRLNVSKTGLGMSVGGGGARYSAHSSGRRTVSARTGIPGVYYQKSVRKPAANTGRRDAAAAPGLPQPKPGLFASKGEKQLYKAIQAQDATLIRAVGDEFPVYRLASYAIAGVMFSSGDEAQSEQLLDVVFATDEDPESDPFVRQYLQTNVTVGIAPGVSAALPLGRDAIGLVLAELKQEKGNLDGAIEVVEHLEPSSYAAVSLADLYSAAERYDDVIELTENLSNTDDISALALTYRGMAFRHKGLNEAAHTSLKEALKSRSRDPAILHLALFERAQNFLAQGKRAMARKDLERIMAEESSYDGVQGLLAEITNATA